MTLRFSGFAAGRPLAVICFLDLSSRLRHVFFLLILLLQLCDGHKGDPLWPSLYRVYAAERVRFFTSGNNISLRGVRLQQ